MLEGAAQAARREVARGLAGHGLAQQPDLACGRIVDARDHVEEGALAGAVGPDQRMHLAGLDVIATALLATRPPKRLVTRSASSSSFAGGRQLAAVAAPAPALASPAAGLQEAAGDACQRRPQALGEALQHEQHQEAEDDHLEIAAGAQQLRQQVLQLLLEQRDQGRAEHRAPQVARAADHRHEQVLDADVEVERRRVHEALQVRVEPARQRPPAARRARTP